MTASRAGVARAAALACRLIRGTARTALALLIGKSSLGLVVVVVRDGQRVVAGVGQHRRGQQFVAVDEFLEGRDPVVVVLPLPTFGFRGALPLPDRRDQGFLEFTPRVVAEL